MNCISIGAVSTPLSTPMVVMNVTDAVELAMGRYHVCVRRMAGGVACWGRNEYGQIGDNSVLPRPAPVTVTLPRPAVHIAAGGYHTCALLDDDSLRCWGANFSGQLGDGTRTQSLVPTASQLCQ